MKKLLLYVILQFLSFEIISYNPEHLKHLYTHFACPNCDLKDAFLQGFTGQNINFEGADLSGASFSGARLPHSNFKNCKLIGTIFNQAIINNSNFMGADLTNAQLVNSYLKEANFHKAILNKTNLYWASLEKANFTYAKFLDTVFSHADLYRANLSNSTGNMIIDYCAGYSPTQSQCQNSMCSYDCTNFCCTTMQDGTLKTDKQNHHCPWDRRKLCSID